jgi:dihydropteroate synthase
VSSIRLYLRPLGLISGDAARAAIEDGWGRPVGGTSLAFTGCQVWLRGPEGLREEVLPAGHVEDWARAHGAAAEAAAREALARLAAPLRLPEPLPQRAPLIMGVVNVTPDSFSDGGRFFRAADAVAHGRRLWQAGAAIIDVGGESTRPGAGPVPQDEEIRRAAPVVRALAGEGIAVSIDSRKAAVMQAAIKAGACMINDVSALRHDPKSLGVAAASGLPVILMHSLGDPQTMQQDPRYERAALDVYDSLEQRIEACIAAGIARERLLVDPGIGFGKTLAHNLDLLHNLFLFRSLGLPVVLGTSRKSFIGRIGGDPASERGPGSLASALFGVLNGVSLVRAHDVAEMHQALRIWQAMAPESAADAPL